MLPMTWISPARDHLLVEQLRNKGAHYFRQGPEL